MRLSAVWRWPLVLAGLTLFGLLSALLGEGGVWWALSWAALAVPLVLSGHTHGGQIVLPFVGAIAAREFPVIAGTGRRDSTAIFVSRGVGTVYIPVRLNCPPEVAILTLQPVEV